MEVTARKGFGNRLICGHSGSSVTRSGRQNPTVKVKPWNSFHTEKKAWGKRLPASVQCSMILGVGLCVLFLCLSFFLMMIKWLLKLCPSHLHLSQEGGGRRMVPQQRPCKLLWQIYFGNPVSVLGPWTTLPYPLSGRKKEAEKWVTMIILDQFLFSTI